MAALFDQTYVSPIMAGRANERQALQQWFQRAAAGSGQVVLLAGEAGIGKSRLVIEARTIARERGFICLQGNCFEPDCTLPFAPFRDLLRHLDLKDLVAVRHLVPDLLKLAPELNVHFPDLASSSVAEPELEKRRRAEAVVSLLAEASVAPKLVIVEDLHWCDDASLEVVLQVARRLQEKRMVLLLTYRNDEQPFALQQFLAQLDRERWAHEYFLAPLGLADVQAIVGAIFHQSHAINSEFVAALYAHTEGNPFFLEEVLKSLVVDDDLMFMRGHWNRERMNRLRVPRTVRLLVTRRMAGLSPAAQGVLMVAAVVGRYFDVDLLMAITGLSEPDLITAIKELMAAQLVVEVSSDEFTFRHELTRQAVYTGMLRRERKALHRTVATTLEGRRAPETDERLGDLSWHFYAGEQWDKALIYSRRAGEQAQALYVPRAATEYYTRAIAAEQALQSSPGLRVLRYARAEAYAQLGEFEPARSDYEAALIASESDGDHEGAWRALLGLGFLWASRDYNRAGTYFQQSLDLAPRLTDTAMVAQTFNRVGNWHMNAERPHEAIRYHREAEHLFDLLGDDQGRAATLDLLGISYYVAGEFPKSTQLYHDAVTLFRTVQDKRGIMTALIIGSSRGTALISRTVPPTRSALVDRVGACEEGLSLAAEIGARPLESMGHAWLGLNYAMAGHYSQALTHMKRGLVIAQQIEHTHFICTAQLLLGVLYWDLAAWSSARTHLEQALVLARDSQSTLWQHHAAAFLVSALLYGGALEQAETVLCSEWNEHLPMVGIGWRQLWAARAEVLLALGAPAESLAVVEQLIASAPSGTDDTSHTIPYLELLRCEALLVLNRTRDVVEHLDVALNAAHGAELPALEWRLEVAMGQVLLAKRRRDDAAARFARAREVVRLLAANTGDPVLGEGLVKAAAAAMRRVDPDSPRRRAKARFDGLTMRERLVAAYVAQGLSNRDIAALLVLSERTVETHIAHILSKLGYTSRAQIAVWAVTKGLAPAPTA